MCHWHTVPLCHWHTVPLTHCATDTLCIDTLTNWHNVHWHTAPLTHCATDTLCFWHTVPLKHCATVLLTHWHTYLLAHWHAVDACTWQTVPPKYWNIALTEVMCGSLPWCKCVPLCHWHNYSLTWWNALFFTACTFVEQTQKCNLMHWPRNLLLGHRKPNFVFTPKILIYCNFFYVIKSVMSGEAFTPASKVFKNGVWSWSVYYKYKNVFHGVPYDLKKKKKKKTSSCRIFVILSF